MSPLISMSQAAAYLDMTASGLRKIVRRGEIQYFQRGRGRIKFRTEWLDEFVATHTHQPRHFILKVGRQRKPKPPQPTGNGDLLGFRDDLYKR
jgi:excisionase family DNA binding protein